MLKANTQLSLPPVIGVGNVVYPVQYSFHRQRSSTARVREGRILLRISCYLSKKEAMSQGQTLLDRITTRLQKKTREAHSHSLYHFPIEDGVIVPTFRDSFRLKKKMTQAKSIVARIEDDQVVIAIPGEVLDSDHDPYLRSCVHGAIAMHYEEDVRSRVEYFHAQHVSTPLGGVRLRSMKSSWGTCSRQGVVTLAHRLLLLPEDLVDYVIAHELAHLIEFNHSPRFWEVVASMCPDYRERRKKLREVG